MKIIRTLPHETYDCDRIEEVFSPAFCQRAGWTAENNYVPWRDGEKKFVLDDETPAEIGWRVREGVPIAPDAKVLEDVKTDKWNEIGAAYAKHDAEANIVTSLGFPLQIGQAHVSKLDGAIRFAELSGMESIYITDSDDVTHTNIPISDAKQALLEAMGAALVAHQHKQELRAAIMAAETIEEIQAVSWS
jgi:hypothetical protein